jgi:hypothetical protein
MIFNSTKTADAAVIGVNALAGYSWIADLNEVLQLVLTVAGIVAAIAAARYHIMRANRIKNRQSATKELQIKNKKIGK